MENKVLLQGFEWYLPDDGYHWLRIAAKAKKLKRSGIDMIWLPPAYKGTQGGSSVGYDVYDKYDLGEFDQKGSVATKYGTKEEYLECIQTLKEEGLEVICDIVMNHMMGADGTETVSVVEDSLQDRNQQISDETSIEAWTRFTFPGRGETYANDTYDYTDFNGTDWDEAEQKSSLFRFADKTWNPDTDWENGNFDYLMGANLDMENPKTAQKVLDWGRWYLDVTQADGLRMDAVKHISHNFCPVWIEEMRKHKKEDFFVVGEYWSGEIERLLHYLDAVDNAYSLFDVPLHYAFHRASTSNGEFDMSTLLNTSLLRARPENAVTFVDNHDTQPEQGLESFISSWFKTQAYALILFQEKGIPCIFYGDLYGIPHNNIAPVTGLTKMCRARKAFAYGTQMDYLDDSSIIGYTRSGDSEHEDSGMAILVTNARGGTKRMYVSMKFQGERFINLLKPTCTPVEIAADGCGDFTVEDGSAAIWIRESAYRKLEIGK